MAIGILFPPSLAVQLTVKAVILTSGLLSNLNSIHQGACQVHKGLTDSQLKTNEKVIQVGSGALSLGFGIAGLVTTLRAASKIYKGWNAFKTLDQEQQMFALKHRAFESLGEVKSKNAIIIDERRTAWEPTVDYPYYEDMPSPTAQVIYQNYNTRTYRVTSCADLQRVLDLAKKELGGKLDCVAFVGHANSNAMYINNNYRFTANQIELSAIKRNIASEGEVILFGCRCSTASTSNSLTQKVSTSVKNVTVTSFSDFLYSYLTWVRFDGRLKFQSQAMENPGVSIVKIFQNGKDITSN